MKTIGELIRQARVAASLSQHQFADKAFVGWVELERIEDGDGPRTTVKTFQRIADALGGCDELQERIDALVECDDHRTNIIDGNFE